MKPTRADFTAAVLAQWPGATVIGADRGLYVVVGSADVAMAIEMKAREMGLKPSGIDHRGAEDFLVRIFGFSRRLVREGGRRQEDQ